MSQTLEMISALEAAVENLRVEIVRLREHIDGETNPVAIRGRVKRPKVTICCGASRWECSTRPDLVACLRDLATHPEAPAPHILVKAYADSVRRMEGSTDGIMTVVKRAEDWAASVNAPAKAFRLSDGRAARAFIDLVEQRIAMEQDVIPTPEGERKIFDLLGGHPATTVEILEEDKC